MPAKKNKSPQEKAKKIKNLKVADGKADVEKIQNLEDLLGVKQSNPFGTTSKDILESRMSEMTLTDLQSFAIKVGILPSGNKLSLKNKIKRAFKSHAGAGSGYNIGYHQPLVDPSSQTAENILKISREGM